jgi:hypothetical protein
MSGFPYFEPLKNPHRQIRCFLMGPLVRTKGQVSDKSNSATSLTQGLSAPLKLSKTCLLRCNDISRWLTLRVTTRTIHKLLGTVLKRTQEDKEGRFSVGPEIISENRYSR